MKICAIIPARYKSTRLPGKPLLKIKDKTIIQRVYEQVKKSTKINAVYITTDDDRIVNHVLSFGGECIKVTVQCLNGTERVCHALNQLDDDYDIVVNVQGDEPFINPRHIDLCIDKMIQNYANDKLVCTTLHYKLSATEAGNPSIGKMVMDIYNNVLYCSRTPIPVTKSGAINPLVKYYGHIGLFIFKASYLPHFLADFDTQAQLSEDIEWLKIMEHGHTIKSYLVTDGVEIGVNTQEDYNYLLGKY